eukprot:683315-Amphidinium_carterae.1
MGINAMKELERTAHHFDMGSTASDETVRRVHDAVLMGQQRAVKTMFTRSSKEVCSLVHTSDKADSKTMTRVLLGLACHNADLMTD